jgi:hypothetical protein
MNTFIGALLTTCLLLLPYRRAGADTRTPAACAAKIDHDFKKTLDAEPQQDVYPIIVVFTKAPTAEQLTKRQLTGTAGTTVATGRLTRTQIWDLCSDKTVRSIAQQSKPKASGQ